MDRGAEWVTEHEVAKELDMIYQLNNIPRKTCWTLNRFNFSKS